MALDAGSPTLGQPSRKFGAQWSRNLFPVEGEPFLLLVARPNVVAIIAQGNGIITHRGLEHILVVNPIHGVVSKH